MIISIIVAIGKNQQIGIDGKIPWHLPQDLKNFKEKTMGHFLLMGRKTFESIGSRHLPGRKIIVISTKAQTPMEGIKIANAAKESELFICGGGEIYGELLPYTHLIYLTEVDYQGAADTFFPKIELSQWACSTEAIHFCGNGNHATFRILKRKVAPLDWSISATN